MSKKRLLSWLAMPTCLSVFFLLNLFFVVPGYALEPQTTSIVQKITIEIPYSYQKDATTIYLGETECKQLIKNAARVKIVFPTSINTVLSSKLYDGLLTFKVARNSTALIDCSKDPTFCSKLEAKYIKHTTTDITLEIDFTELTGMEKEEDCANVNEEFFVRAHLRLTESDESFSPADVRFVIDAVGPAPPELTSVSATQSSLLVSFTSSEEKDIQGFAVVVSDKPLTAGALPEKADAQVILFGNEESKKESVPVAMQPGKQYYVAVSARDETGNIGPMSTVKTVEPVETIDFWKAYKDAGGEAEGGCSTVPKGDRVAPFILLFGLLFMRGRRRRTRRIVKGSPRH